MLRAGFIGWRGLVGSVLMERMLECGDFNGLECGFFSTSSVGGRGPTELGFDPGALLDAYDVEALADFDVLISCQGGDYTRAAHPKLRGAGWRGYWIDAASTLRMEPQSVLMLDPIDADVVQSGLAAGRLDYCGPNCTVSLMLMALGGLFKADLVEWMTSMTYQAASGAGAKSMIELAAQIADLGDTIRSDLHNPAATALDIDRSVRGTLASPGFPTEQFGAPLAASLLPWIDKPVAGGQSREEWKGGAEGNKILGRSEPIPIDGLCVRIAAMRCHAQAFTIKLRRDVPLSDIEAIIGAAHEWVEVIENAPGPSLAGLTPAAVTGSLMVPVGRVRKLQMGGEYLTAFSVGDQLLWGAAEPLRRMLDILRTHLGEGRGETESSLADPGTRPAQVSAVH